MSHKEGFPLPMPTRSSVSPANNGVAMDPSKSASVSSLRQVKKTYQDGEYDGEHNVSEEREGYGVMKYTEGDVYQGEWRDDMQHGKGEIVYSDGDKYIGQFQNGNFHGYGEYFYKNGDR